MNGSLILKLGDSCQDYTKFEIKTLDWEIPESFKMIVRNCDGKFNLIPEIHEENTVKVNCMRGSVDIDSASWQDMLKMKLEKNNSHWFLYKNNNVNNLPKDSIPTLQFYQIYCLYLPTYKIEVGKIKLLGYKCVTF